MTITVNDFAETIESISRNSSNIALRDGRSTRSFHLFVNVGDFNPTSPVIPSDISQNLFPLILGDVTTAAKPGATSVIGRVLPMADPQYPWLYASHVAGVKGIGQPIKQTAETPQLTNEYFPYYAVYPQYEVTIEFTPRPYILLDNSLVQISSLEWTDMDDEVFIETVANEWCRFVDYQTAPQNDWLTAQIGGDFIFSTKSTSSPNNFVFPAQPRIYLPNEIVKMTWFSVPWRYWTSTNSFLRQYRGFINQTDWYDWKAGELLYLNCCPNRYTPPTQVEQSIIITVGNGKTTTDVSLVKWMDVELIFLATRRIGNDLPTPASDNHIAAGHNLFPHYSDRKFYYAKSKSTDAPFFYSVPFQLLFSDPDV